MAGMGEVEIQLGGKTETLKSTLRAAKLVSGGADGFQGVLRQLAMFQLDVYIGVVAAGLGKKPGEVEEAVYKSGLVSLTEQLTEYVMLLTNGGKPLSIPEDSKSGEA